LPVSIQIGATGGSGRKAGNTSAGPLVVININASAGAEPGASQATSADAPQNAGAAPTLSDAQVRGTHAHAGRATTATVPGLVFDAGPAPSLADFKATPAVSHAAASYPPGGAVSAGGAPPAEADGG
jgi:hypothetical protein